jgi:hypothetical protein
MPCQKASTAIDIHEVAIRHFLRIVNYRKQCGKASYKAYLTSIGQHNDLQSEIVVYVCIPISFINACNIICLHRHHDVHNWGWCGLPRCRLAMMCCFDLGSAGGIDPREQLENLRLWSKKNIVEHWMVDQPQIVFGELAWFLIYIYSQEWIPVVIRL